MNVNLMKIVIKDLKKFNKMIDYINIPFHTKDETDVIKEYNDIKKNDIDDFIDVFNDFRLSDPKTFYKNYKTYDEYFIIIINGNSEDPQIKVKQKILKNIYEELNEKKNN